MEGEREEGGGGGGWEGAEKLPLREKLRLLIGSAYSGVHSHCLTCTEIYMVEAAGYSRLCAQCS